MNKFVFPFWFLILIFNVSSLVESICKSYVSEGYEGLIILQSIMLFILIVGFIIYKIDEGRFEKQYEEEMKYLETIRRSNKSVKSKERKIFYINK